MGPHVFLRLKRWAHRPPSRRRMVLIGVVIALGLLIAGLEHWGLWPDALTTERIGLRGIPRGL